MDAILPPFYRLVTARSARGRFFPPAVARSRNAFAARAITFRSHADNARSRARAIIPGGSRRELIERPIGRLTIFSKGENQTGATTRRKQVARASSDTISLLHRLIKLDRNVNIVAAGGAPVRALCASLMFELPIFARWNIISTLCETLISKVI